MRDDPMRQFAAWWADAEVPMVLATSGPPPIRRRRLGLRPRVGSFAADACRPTARAVVLESFDERGFCFWTSSESPAGRALADDPRAALVWLWDGRQARVEGRVQPVSEAENEEHWRARKGKRQLVAFHQSEPVESREELLALLETVPDDPPRPSFWVGYRVVPDRFEFWVADEDFVHDRFEFTREGGEWRRTRLQP